MTINEFNIGSEFFCGGKKWRCTDLGSRVIIAISVSGTHAITTYISGDGKGSTCTSERSIDSTWFNGPPYAVEELVFDEDAQLGCTVNELEQ